MRRRRFLSLSATLAIGAMVSIGSAAAGEPAIFTGLVEGVGAGGYDVVAYFNDGKPTKGDASIAAQHDAVTYRFASEDNRAAFLASPTRYLPQYGGYCAYAVSRNYTAKGDPEAWTVVDGKLYLNYSREVRTEWSKDVAGNIAAGDGHWPKVLE